MSDDPQAHTRHGDGGHRVTDSPSLALAAFAAWLASRPPTTGEACLRDE
ncbi:hypothetical protein [Candidatus Accumulibacter aalborgensis]|nr:hypothetical protein [Candidatus Accumulibacter aalborgensis]